MNQPVSEREKAIVRALQQDLPLVPQPFKALAESIGITEQEFLEGASELQRRGCMKRVSVSLYHQNVGYTTNVMLVWDVPDEYVSLAGKQASTHPAVTHCYCRNRQPEFPYNFYTMVHCRSDEEYETVRQKLSGDMEKIVGKPVHYAGLRSEGELKKSGMLYFLEKPEEMVGGSFREEKHAEQNT